MLQTAFPSVGPTGTTTANYELASRLDLCDLSGCIVTAGWPSNGYKALAQVNGVTFGTNIAAWRILTFPQPTGTSWQQSGLTTQIVQLITLKGSDNVCAATGGWFGP